MELGLDLLDVRAVGVLADEVAEEAGVVALLRVEVGGLGEERALHLVEVALPVLEVEAVAPRLAGFLGQGEELIVGALGVGAAPADVPGERVEIALLELEERLGGLLGARAAAPHEEGQRPGIVLLDREERVLGLEPARAGAAQVDLERVLVALGALEAERVVGVGVAHAGVGADLPAIPVHRPGGDLDGLREHLVVAEAVAEREETEARERGGEEAEPAIAGSRARTSSDRRPLASASALAQSSETRSSKNGSSRSMRG